MGQNNEELKHYGVLGMKWGVRRATKSLSSAKTSGDKEKAMKALSSLEKHRGKIDKKLTKLNEDRKSLEKKNYKAITKGNVKAAKYEKKAAKLEAKSLKTWSNEKSYKLDKKAAKLNIKAAKIKADATKVKSKIEKNEKLKKTYSSYLSSVDKTLVDNGKKFIN